GHHQRRTGTPDGARVPRPFVPDASSRPCRLAERAARSHLRERWRSRFEHRRGLHRAASQEAWCGQHRDGARAWLPDGAVVTQRSLRSRLMTFLLIWGTFAIGFLVLAGAMHLSLLSRWRLHLVFPIAGGLLFIAFGALVVRRGLSPFRIMRERLADVRDGRSARLDGD